MVGKDKKVLTLGVFAHANAGKTTITERLLYHTGIIESLGRVDSGNTVTDNLKVEKERGITVRDTLVSFELDGKNIQLIDTPGHIDFSAEVERAISVLDGAILVISGVEGIEAQTFTIWRALQEKKIPVIVFINKMDRKGANFERVLGELQKFLNIPTLTLTRVYQDNDGGLKIKHSSLDEIIEEVSLVDDEVLEHYINNNQINNELVADRIIELTRDCKLFPVIGGSALTGVGVQDLIKSIGKYIPTSIKDIDSPLSAFVYTIRVDETGKNAYVKILSGSISLKDNLKLADDKTGKVNRMYLAEGSKLTPVNTASSGDIVIINGLDVKCGDLIGETKGLNNYISFVNPLLTMEIKSINNGDSIALVEEDSKSCLEEMLFKIQSLLNDKNISNELKIRTKNIYGIYKRLSEGQKISDIHDLLALKVILEDVESCYQTLGIVHSEYHPINDKFKDYIYNPKTNMYKSLHTTVFGPNERLVQTQIRTNEMDQIAAHGLTAYWDINRGQARDTMQEDLTEKYQFFKSLVEINTMFGNNQEFVAQVKREIFTGKVYVYTTKGDIIELPAGATPIDFAYKIHTDIGNTMVGVTVNEEHIAIDYMLKNKDRVRIITDNLSFGPREEWENIAQTSHAKRKIKEFNKNIKL